jgi:long-chain fatty acid transport protein
LSDRPENWHGTWFGSIGARYRPAPDWVFRGGFAFDSRAVSTQFRTARLPDSDRYWLAAGVGYRLTPAVALDVAYAHIFARNASISEASPTGDLLTGRYAAHVDIVALSTTFRF